MNFIASRCRHLLLTKGYFILICLLLGTVSLQSAWAESSESERVGNNVEKKSGGSQLGGINLFFPSHDWRVIEPDATVFAGLHYRINVSTGRKEAKLMDDGAEYYRLLELWIRERQAGDNTMAGEGVMQQFQAAKKHLADEIQRSNDDKIDSNEREESSDGSNQYSLAEVPVEGQGDSKKSASGSEDDEQKKSFLEDLVKLDDSHSSFDETVQELLKSSDNKSPDSSPGSAGVDPSKFRSYEELKQELADLELLIDDEQHVMQTLISQHQDITTQAELVKSVEDMEYLLHNIDNAQVFIDYGGLSKVVLPGLNSSSPELRALSCRLITACVQNFPKGQIAALEAHLLPRLLTLLQSELTSGVQSRALSSVSGMVRQFPVAQTELIRIGLPVLRSLLRQPQLKLKTKVTTLLADLLLERVDEEDTSERGQQLRAVGLEAALLDLDWCHHLTENLRQTADSILGDDEQNSEQFLDTLLHALHASVALCPVEFHSTLPTLHHLEATFRHEVDAVTSTDKAELYQETADSIHGLVNSFLTYNNRDKPEL